MCENQSYFCDLPAKDNQEPLHLVTYEKANNAELDGNYSASERQLHGIAFSELVAYIEETDLHLSDN